MIAADSVERTANNSARAALQQPAPGRPRRRGHRGVVLSAPTSRTSRPDARGAAGWCRHCCPARRRRDTAAGLRCSSWRPPPAYEAARAPRWPEVPGADFSRPPRANADESRKSKHVIPRALTRGTRHGRWRERARPSARLRRSSQKVTAIKNPPLYMCILSTAVAWSLRVSARVTVSL